MRKKTVVDREMNFDELFFPVELDVVFMGLEKLLISNLG